ncbi:MAG: ATP-binding cassette domain-containing protein, partial [Eubacteriales bacterium]
MGEIIVETKKITKHFGEVVAVNGVDLQVELGRVHGLIGENGSGKSTISSMICGIHSITSGEVWLKGKPYKPSDPGDARLHGIGMIVQEVGTIDYLSVAENIFLGEESRFGKAGFVSRAAMEAEARKALAAVGLDIDVSLPAISYNFETRKMVEIAKTLYYEPQLLIIDETTTALSQDGREKIHEIMRDFAANNKAVLFISHDLPELMETCDLLTVLRDGKLIANIEKKDFNEDHIKQTMVGRKIEGNYYRADFDPSCEEQVALSVEAVTTDSLKNIDLTVHCGEIVGIGGLSGSGMHELGKLLFGMEKIRQGRVVAYAPEQMSAKMKRTVNRQRLHATVRMLQNSARKLLKKPLRPVALEEERP